MWDSMCDSHHSRLHLSHVCLLASDRLLSLRVSIFLYLSSATKISRRERVRTMTGSQVFPRLVCRNGVKMLINDDKGQ
jgi:hypothetical protein